MLLELCTNALPAHLLLQRRLPAPGAASTAAGQDVAAGAAGRPQLSLLGTLLQLQLPPLPLLAQPLLQALSLERSGHLQWASGKGHRVYVEHRPARCRSYDVPPSRRPAPPHAGLCACTTKRSTRRRPSSYPVLLVLGAVRAPLKALHRAVGHQARIPAAPKRRQRSASGSGTRGGVQGGVASQACRPTHRMHARSMHASMPPQAHCFRSSSRTSSVSSA